MTLKPELIPFPIIALAVIALVAHIGLMWSPYGAVLRGVGGNARAVERAGWSLLRAKVTMYALAGIAGVLAGMALLGLSGAADARFGERYTLLSIAAVILGGGEFVGGRVSPVGAVVGAATLLLVNSLLTFLKLPPDWQIGAQGSSSSWSWRCGCWSTEEGGAGDDGDTRCCAAPWPSPGSGPISRRCSSGW